MIIIDNIPIIRMEHGDTFLTADPSNGSRQPYGNRGQRGHPVLVASETA
jgi:hypothetical protein